MNTKTVNKKAGVKKVYVVWDEWSEGWMVCVDKPKRANDPVGMRYWRALYFRRLCAESARLLGFGRLDKSLCHEFALSRAGNVFRKADE
jgi:hypothetical protein